MLLGERLDVIQSVDSHCLFGNVVTVHYSNAERLELIKRGVFRPSPRWVRRSYDWVSWNLARTMEFVRYRLVPLDTIICISRGLTENLAEHCGVKAKVAVIPNSADANKRETSKVEARTLLAQEHGIGRDAFVLLFIGAGDWDRKGLRHIIEALPGLPDRVQLVVVGSGTAGQVSVFRSLSETMGVERRVIFAGAQPKVDVFLTGADLFVFPSHFEGFALVTLEAAAAGLPMLCTDVNGVRDLFGDSECGLIIHPSAEDIRTNVLCLLSEPTKLEAMSRSCLQRAQSFTRERVAGLTLAVYRDVRDRGRFRSSAKLKNGSV